MTILSREELKALIEQPAEPCVSIYMPTHRAGRETQQGPIRLKNLLRDAEDQLTASGLDSAEVQQLLEPMQALIDDTMFWQYQLDGLALFRSAHLFRSYQLPLDVDELVVIAQRFHVKPLMSLFTNNEQFYILALSQNNIRLLQGTQHTVHEIELQNTPTSIEAALQYDDPEKQTQFYTGTQGANTKGGAGGGDRAAIFYGTGSVGADQRKDILRYFHKVDDGLHDEVLRDEQTPLVLAGVEYLLPIYHEATSYKNVLEAGVTGNPDTLRPEELQQQAWEVIGPHFRQAQEAAVEQFGNATGQGLASTDLSEIAAAAYFGRVGQIFIATGRQQWGTFDPQANAVELHDEGTHENEDMLDFAAIHTFLNSGTVFAVEPDQVPEGALAAAVFRY